MASVKTKLKTITNEFTSGSKLAGILFLALCLGAISVVLGDELLE